MILSQMVLLKIFCQKQYFLFNTVAYNILHYEAWSNYDINIIHLIIILIIYNKIAMETEKRKMV